MITKEQAIKNLREAIKHKHEAVERTRKQWEDQGLKGKVVLI